MELSVYRSVLRNHKEVTDRLTGWDGIWVKEPFTRDETGMLGMMMRDDSGIPSIYMMAGSRRSLDITVTPAPKEGFAALIPISCLLDWCEGGYGDQGTKLCRRLWVQSHL